MGGGSGERERMEGRGGVLRRIGGESRKGGGWGREEGEVGMGNGWRRKVEKRRERKETISKAGKYRVWRSLLR